MIKNGKIEKEKVEKPSYTFLWKSVKQVCKHDFVFIILIVIGMILAFYPPILLVHIVNIYIYKGRAVSEGLWISALGYLGLLAATEFNIGLQHYTGVRIVKTDIYP